MGRLGDILKTGTQNARVRLYPVDSGEGCLV
jgi:hypothetical protein